MKNLTFILLTIISMIFIGCTNNSTGASFEDIDSSSNSIDTIYTHYNVDSCRYITNGDYDDSLTLINVRIPNEEITYDEIKSDMDNFDSTKISTKVFNGTFYSIDMNYDGNFAIFNDIIRYNVQDSINISNILNNYKSFSTWKFMDEHHILYYGGIFENHKYKYYFYILYISNTMVEYNK